MIHVNYPSSFYDCASASPSYTNNIEHLLRLLHHNSPNIPSKVDNKILFLSNCSNRLNNTRILSILQVTVKTLIKYYERIEGVNVTKRIFYHECIDKKNIFRDMA